MRNTSATELLFDLSRPGRQAGRMPDCDVPDVPLGELLPDTAMAAEPPPLPELSELDVVRHFTNLSTQNMSVDTHFYPLGSCTMKYNPKRNERSGNDTGGCQIFITHLPTPHLDGRYTVFAQVIAGFDVVDRIRVGDRIEKATLEIRKKR